MISVLSLVAFTLSGAGDGACERFEDGKVCGRVNATAITLTGSDKMACSKACEDQGSRGCCTYLDTVCTWLKRGSIVEGNGAGFDGASADCSTSKKGRYQKLMREYEEKQKGSHQAAKERKSARSEHHAAKIVLQKAEKVKTNHNKKLNIVKNEASKEKNDHRRHHGKSQVRAKSTKTRLTKAIQKVRVQQNERELASASEARAFAKLNAEVAWKKSRATLEANRQSIRDARAKAQAKAKKNSKN